MSGIFGLLDPDGVDRRAVQMAAGEVASYRGGALAVGEGPIALGVFHRSEPSLLLERPGRILVADARVDGTVAGTPASRAAETHAGLDLLDTVLEDLGPEGLAGIAADFALARYDARRQRLLLSRDAFGVRPLFWARDGRRVGFASDPSILLALGLASGELERPVITAFLARRELLDGRTAFTGVRWLPGGTWRSFDVGGREDGGRWFRPEEVAQRELTLEEAAEEARVVIRAAVVSRAAGRKVALQLSGGRDSATVAVALAEEGVSATCLTQTFDPDLHLSEIEPARAVARAEGHGWRAVPVPSRVTPEDLDSLPAENGSPLGYPAFPLSISLADAAREVGAEISLTGHGGEPLFFAPPVAMLDLVRGGRIGEAVAAMRAYRHQWIYPYRVQAKALARALLPHGIMRLRERMRPVAPWVGPPIPREVDPHTAPSSAREHLIAALLTPWGYSDHLEERLYQRRGVELAHPFLDMRVVNLALALPVRLRVPMPAPKPVLSRAFLGRWEASRVKMVFSTYYFRLAESTISDFPWLAESDSLSAASGFVLPGEIGKAADPRWMLEFLSLVPVEAWLRTYAS